MELIYIQLDYAAMAERVEAEDLTFSLKPEIPLPYISYTEDDELNWNSIVDGIMYVALYEPKHEHSDYYRDFLLQLEQDLPVILRERLREQYDEQLWEYARDTVRILIFLLPDATWPLLELCYLYEQEAEYALLRHRFHSCCETWNLAHLSYRQLLESEGMDANGYYQLGCYYLQCWNFPGAHRAFVSSQQLALSPENPLWGKCHAWLQKMSLLEFEREDAPEAQKLFRDLSRIQSRLQSALSSKDFSQAESSEGKELFAPIQSELNELLQEHPESGFLWFLRGLCLLYGNNLMSLRDLAEDSALVGAGSDKTGRSASQSFARAQSLGWETPLAWQLPYYEGMSRYLEGDYSGAEQKFLELLKENPEHGGGLYWMERLYEDLEDERSYQYRNVMQEWHPDFPDLLQDFL